MNKDFYAELPSCICEILEDLIEKYGKEKWFIQAWEEYRQHIFNSSIDDMKMPSFIFNDYIAEENK